MAEPHIISGQESAQLWARVVVVDPDDVAIFSSDPADNVPILAIEDGSITLDDTARIQGTGDVTLLIDADHEDMVPTGPASTLSPISDVSVRVYAGAIDPSTGLPSLAKMGKFEITDTDIEEDEGGGLRIKLQLKDNWRKIERARFYRARKLAKGTNFEDALRYLLSSVLPDETITVTPTTHTTPLLTWDEEDDRVDAISKVLTAIGYIMRMDGDGNPQAVPDVDTSDDPIWAFAQGNNTEIETIGGAAMLLGGKRRLSDDETYNGVVVRGEPTGDDKPPVRAEVWDTNPDSLTYYDPTKPDESSYGPVPFFYVSPLITTVAQAISAGRKLLPKKVGIAERLEVTTLFNAAVRPGQPVQIDRPRMGLSGTFVVQAVTYPLVPGHMSIICRERRLFS